MKYANLIIHAINSLLTFFIFLDNDFFVNDSDYSIDGDIFDERKIVLAGVRIFLTSSSARITG
ncbi:hypothetical protein [Paenibacillus periandrae]|uniref:hypothetical protein n=1 Tax=Paenibacillus periandrae TaxID=1761741 RepID=UPI001F088CFD|nr:hypothetical protein [Paenibacillus periandrae]